MAAAVLVLLGSMSFIVTSGIATVMCRYVACQNAHDLLVSSHDIIIQKTKKRLGETIDLECNDPRSVGETINNIPTHETFVSKIYRL